MTYVFSEEICIKEQGKIKRRAVGIWTFGDRNKTFTVVAGSEDAPLTYEQAKTFACEGLVKMGYPMYKTIYLHSMTPVIKVSDRPRRSKGKES